MWKASETCGWKGHRRAKGTVQIVDILAAVCVRFYFHTYVSRKLKTKKVLNDEDTTKRIYLGFHLENIQIRVFSHAAPHEKNVQTWFRICNENGGGGAKKYSSNENWITTCYWGMKNRMALTVHSAYDEETRKTGHKRRRGKEYSFFCSAPRRI